MKKISVSLTVTGLFLFGLYLLWIGQAKADPQTRKSYDFVVLQGYPDLRQQVQNGNAHYNWHGCFVFNYDNSSNAPGMELPQLGGDFFDVASRTNRLAQTLSDLSNQGFEVISSSENTSELTFVLRRLRVHSN